MKALSKNSSHQAVVSACDKSTANSPQRREKPTLYEKIVKKMKPAIRDTTVLKIAPHY